MTKIKLNDITEKTELTYFGDLEVGDYFIETKQDVIWKKVNGINAIQITSNDLTICQFDYYETVDKIEITSINYRRVKNDKVK